MRQIILVTGALAVTPENLAYVESLRDLASIGERWLLPRAGAVSATCEACDGLMWLDLPAQELRADALAGGITVHTLCVYDAFFFQQAVNLLQGRQDARMFLARGN